MSGEAQEDGKTVATQFSVGDWVNIPSDAERGNVEPAVVIKVSGDDDIRLRWPWGECCFAWSADELVHVSPPASGKEA